MFKFPHFIDHKQNPFTRFGDYGEWASTYEAVENGFLLDEYDLLFDKSWDWLMPVVEKIGKIPNRNENGLFAYEVCVELNPVTGVTIEDMYRRNFNSDKGYEKQTFYENDLLTNTYNAVVHFIKWYNENK
ncbi:MAG: hypothetical protein PQJ49_12530 [Sphaerochaetaceae bacterium]|nr:hypothetical protein [Sphaerochaetaceae bacterium]